MYVTSKQYRFDVIAVEMIPACVLLVTMQQNIVQIWEELYPGFIIIREMSGKLNFLSRLRNSDVSGKNEILQKCQGILNFICMKLGCLVLM